MKTEYRLTTCRVCGEQEINGSMIKYGVRHYAHPKCGLEKWGVEFLDRLHGWQLDAFPALVAKRAGLLDALMERALNARQARSNLSSGPR